jgi:Tfp pilus assembly protein PilX
MSRFHRLVRRGEDDGVALITALMVMLVLLAFGSVVAVLGVNNLRNGQNDRAAGSSLGAGDAGVAQAIEYLRSNGVAGLTCPDSNP